MTLRLHPDVSTAETADGLVLLNERTGGYWQLNATGAFVLRQLLDGQETSDVAARLAGRHQVERDRADRDVAAVVDRLREAQLVQDR